jgi:hypothetical protein
MILSPKTWHTTIWKDGAINFKVIGELFRKKSLSEDLGKTFVPSRLLAEICDSIL